MTHHPSGNPPAALNIRVRHLVALFAWAVAITLFIYFFPTAKLVILGVLASGCLAAALRPIARRIPGPRAVKAFAAGMIPFAVLAGALFSAGRLLRDNVQKELAQWPVIKQNVNDMLASAPRWFGLDETLDIETLLSSVRSFLTGAQGQQIVGTTAAALASFGVALLFVFFATIYLLLEPEGRLTSPLLRMLPPRRRRHAADAVECLAPRLRWWTAGVAVSMTTVGLATWAGLSMAGLQLAAPLALLVAVAEIVPNIGPFLAFLVALLFGAAQGKALGVLIVWIVVQTLESYLLTPFVMKKAVSIPPFVTLVSVIFWGKLFGLGGVLLAIPLNLLVWSFVEQFLLRRYDSVGKGVLPAMPTHDANPSSSPAGAHSAADSSP